MFGIDKVQFSSDSGFDIERARKLANLISVTYNEYEVWDSLKDTKDAKLLLQDSILSFNAFIPLDTDELENIQRKDGSPTTKDYQWLARFWKTKPE